MDRLLIVDDNIELLQLYTMMISRGSKYRVAGLAGGGRDAVSKFSRMKKKPDLVLMDVNMPDMDGISAAKAIKCLDKDANILFVTADNIYMSDLPPELSNAGILRKPFSKDEFFHTIGKSLGKRLSRQYGP